jgi:hypothetical protein
VMFKGVENLSGHNNRLRDGPFLVVQRSGNLSLNPKISFYDINKS